MVCDVTVSKGTATVRLSGNWSVGQLGRVEKALMAAEPTRAKRCVIDGSGLESLDTTGAWLLIEWLRGRLPGVKAERTGFAERHDELIALLENIEHPPSPKGHTVGHVAAFIIDVGEHVCTTFRRMQSLLAFFGRLALVFGRTVMHPSRFRLRSTIYHVYHICIRAVPIVALLAFLISIVLGYQGATQLRKFGAEIFTVDLVAISVLREMAVLITAIMVAGRSGSAFAAQIGVMKLNEEIDAMQTLGLDPFEILVLPRVLAIMIALPILTFIADLVGLAGTWFVSYALLDISWLQFIDRLQAVVSPMKFYIGLMKAPVFALLIGLVGCHAGMRVRNSADQVGLQTTVAVVQAIFLVILCDALFSVLFTKMGI